MRMKGILHDCLEGVGKDDEDMFNLIVKHTAAIEGVTEHLKAMQPNGMAPPHEKYQEQSKRICAERTDISVKTYAKARRNYSSPFNAQYSICSLTNRSNTQSAPS